MLQAMSRSRLSLPVGPRDHVRGAEDAQVTLLQYGDFECPQCAEAFPILVRLQTRWESRLRFVFRHFPLTNVHPHAQEASEAAEWAASHRTFWPMHDALYAQRAQLSRRRIIELAAALHLDTSSLEHAWGSHAFLPRVKEDYLSGLASQVTGTPAFFINGVRHEGQWDESSLDDALSRAAGG
jgi:protein-disulfide isomerase